MKSLLWIWVGCLVVSCAVKQSAPLKKTPRSIVRTTVPMTVLYQAARHGELEPCGCESTPFGGIDREYNAVQDVHRENQFVVYVDGGDSLAPAKLHAGLRHHQTKADTVIQMMNELQVSAFAPGPQDYALTLRYLKQARKTAKFPFVSTNVVDTRTEKLAFAESAVVEHQVAVNGSTGTVRIGILSATPASLKVRHLKAKNPQLAAQAALKRLRPEVDMVVLLSQLTHTENRKLAETGEFDLIVGANQEITTEEALWFAEGRTLLVDSLERGYRLGRLNLDLRLPLKGFFDPGQVYANNNRIYYWEARQAEAKKKKDAKLAAKAATKIARLKEKGYLSVIKGGTQYLHWLVKPNATEHGKENIVSRMKKMYREDVRKRALSE